MLTAFDLVFALHATHTAAAFPPGGASAGLACTRVRRTPAAPARPRT